MKADEIIDGFISYLKAKKAIGLLPEIVSRLNKIVDLEQNTAQVTSAVVLTEEEVTKLKAFLKKEFGKDLILELNVDPKILGGIKITVGDLMIDRTIASRIDSLVSQIEE